jgi:hypothetical protein
MKTGASCRFLFLFPKKRFERHHGAAKSEDIGYHGSTADGSDHIDGVDPLRTYKTTQE